MSSADRLSEWLDRVVRMSLAATAVGRRQSSGENAPMARPATRRKGKRRNQRPFAKVLRIEPLEQRCLLSIDMFFAQEAPQSGQEDVYVYWPTVIPKFDATFIGNGKAGQAVPQNKSFLLSELSDGIRLNNVVSLVTYVSIGAPIPPLPGNTSPAIGNPGALGGNVRWQTMELTYIPGDPNSVANLTNVSVATEALQVETYKGNKSNIVDTLKYNSRFDTILKTLNGLLTGSDAKKAQIHIQVGNKFIQFVSPSSVSAAATGVYPSFADYLAHMRDVTDPGKPNPKPILIKDTFGTSTEQFDMKATVFKDRIELTGSAGGGTGTITIANGNDQKTLTQKIYGAPVGDETTYDVTGTLVKGSISVKNAMRDLYTGFAFGFVGSTVTVGEVVAEMKKLDPSYQTPAKLQPLLATKVGELISADWFELPLAYQHVQPNNTYYSQYSQQILELGGKDVYSYPFTDRWSAGKVQASIADTTVDGLIVTLLNDSAGQVFLSQSDVQEEQVAGTAVGAFNTTNSDAGGHTFSLVSGPGDTDNAFFQIVSNQLQTNAVLDFETQEIHSVRVRATTPAGLSFDQVFAVNVINVLELHDALLGPEINDILSGPATRGRLAPQQVDDAFLFLELASQGSSATNPSQFLEAGDLSLSQGLLNDVGMFGTQIGPFTGSVRPSALAEETGFGDEIEGFGDQIDGSTGLFNQDP